jgi:ppGpp synthetase/RelA/SpoT-type nucleotidyltranferase
VRDDLRAAYEERLPLLQELAAKLEHETRRQFEGVPHIDRISFRAKGVESFLEKVLERRVDPPYAEPLIEVEDQVGGRILVFFVSDVDSAREQAERLFTPVEAVLRRPETYNVFDYESFHAIYGISPASKPAGWDERDDLPRTFELQIRTLFQHAYAEPQHDLAYKPETPPSDEIRRELAWVAASSWGADQALERVRVELAEEADAEPAAPAGD